jgi:glycosyltransferase involved in cell wall biosynthesis
VNAATAVSDFTAKWAASYYAMSADRVRTLYNGVDLAHFHPAAQSRPGHPTINFLGRTGMEKGPDILLDAALLVSQKTRDFSLQLLGSNHWDRFELDDYQRLLNNRVERLESRGVQVRRPGHIARKALPAQLQQAQINVVPARWDEPFGLTTLEGMACGLATVAARTGGTPEVVGDAGLLFERESTVELAQVLEQLIRDSAMRVEYGQRARRRAEQFSWDRCWNTLLACCR